jgi:fatty-acyl-CoA synthase
MQATPTENNLPLRGADFPTLAEALDYAAQGKTGYNFYTNKGKLSAVLPYAQLREEAQVLALRLHSLGLEHGTRMALVADTHPDFQRFFFACQYAGLVPVPLPAVISMGSRNNYVEHLRRLLVSSQTAVAMAHEGFIEFLAEAAAGLDLKFFGAPNAFADLPQSTIQPLPIGPMETAYIQYTSGSTHFPRGVVISQKAVLNNLKGILGTGLRVQPGDRCVSWLPYYHDMGFVGFVLAPMAFQCSVDYLDTQAFAMRPRQWLALMTQSRATISFGPPFGYELCARRVRKSVDQFDLSAWRVAGVGAEMIRPDFLKQFAKIFAPCGFDKKAFLACYGMAECSLAVSFAPLGQGLDVDIIDTDHFVAHQEVLAVEDASEEGRPLHTSTFVKCGKPLPGYEVVVRDRQRKELPDKYCGTIFIKGPSIMSGYLGNIDATREVLSQDGWLNTGDIGYRIQGNIVITGREKDLIIINGRNIWAQDLEYLAEQQPGVRPRDTIAFSVPDAKGKEIAVMVVQCRESDPAKRKLLTKQLQGLIRHGLGIDCFVELVPLHTLPRTSSGKPSRSKARQDFIQRIGLGHKSAQKRPITEHPAKYSALDRYYKDNPFADLSFSDYPKRISESVLTDK